MARNNPALARPSVSVVMPAFNEAEGVLAALAEAESCLRDLERQGHLGAYEVLLVDDGSTDGTGDLARGYGDEHPRTRVLVHPRNRGVGAGLRTGIAAASGDLLLYTDADMPVQLSELPTAIEALCLPGTGLVAGRRQDFDGEPRLRRVLARVYDRLAGRLFGLDLADVNFPFKLMRTDLARGLDLASDGALADVELLHRVRSAGLGITSLPMAYRSRQVGTSKTMSARLLSRLAVELVRYRWSLRRAAQRPE